MEQATYSIKKGSCSSLGSGTAMQAKGPREVENHCFKTGGLNPALARRAFHMSLWHGEQVIFNH